MRLQHLCLWIFGCGLAGGLAGSLAACQQGGAFDPLETATTQDLGQGKGQDLLPAVVDCKDAAAATATRCRVGDLRFLLLEKCDVPEQSWQDNAADPSRIQLGIDHGSTAGEMCNAGSAVRTCGVQLRSVLKIGTAKSVHLKFSQEHYFTTSLVNQNSYGASRGILFVNQTQIYEASSNLPEFPYSIELPVPANLIQSGSISISLQNEFKCLNFSSRLGMFWNINNMTLEIER